MIFMTIFFNLRFNHKGQLLWTLRNEIHGLCSLSNNFHLLQLVKNVSIKRDIKAFISWWTFQKIFSIPNNRPNALWTYVMYPMKMLCDSYGNLGNVGILHNSTQLTHDWKFISFSCNILYKTELSKILLSCIITIQIMLSASK